MATVNIDSTRNFKDLDLSFAIHPVRKDVNIHKAEYAVINSVKNLILTNHYEKPFRPQIGSNIRKLLFENIDSIIAAQIESAVVETINNFEPRVSVSEITAIPDPDNNRYKLQLEFFVINQTTPITINFFLERIR
jgi:phage baseplate assembly protein W